MSFHLQIPSTKTSATGFLQDSSFSSSEILSDNADLKHHIYATNIPMLSMPLRQYEYVVINKKVMHVWIIDHVENMDVACVTAPSDLQKYMLKHWGQHFWPSRWFLLFCFLFFFKKTKTTHSHWAAAFQLQQNISFLIMTFTEWHHHLQTDEASWKHGPALNSLWWTCNLISMVNQICNYICMLCRSLDWKKCTIIN